MSRVLVDSSVWIDYFNRHSAKSDALTDLIDNNAICTNDLILAELLPFIRHSGAAPLAALLLSVARLEMKVDWAEIIEMQSLNLKNGLNKIGIPDLIIMQNAIKSNVLLFSFDRHFSLMQKVHKFEMYQ